MANTFNTTCARARSRARVELDASSIVSLTIDTGAAAVSFTDSVTNSGQLVFARGVPVVFSLSQCSVRSVRTSRPLPGGRFDAYPREALSRSTDGAVRRKPISISASIQSLLSLFYATLVVLLETYIKTTFLRAPCIVGTHLSPPFPHWALFNLQSSLLECSFASSASNNLSQNLRLHLHRVELRHTRRSLGELYLTGTVISDRCRPFVFSFAAA